MSPSTVSASRGVLPLVLSLPEGTAAGRAQRKRATNADKGSGEGGREKNDNVDKRAEANYRAEDKFKQLHYLFPCLPTAESVT